MDIELKPKDLGLGAALMSGVLCLFVLILNPTEAPSRAALALAKTASTLEGWAAHAQGPKLLDNPKMSSLSEHPIFIMSSGPNAYKPKVIMVLGVSITPKRHAALVALEGQSPIWIRVGEVIEDMELQEVGMDGALFQTPLGERMVRLNEPASTSSGTSEATLSPGGGI